MPFKSRSQLRACYAKKLSEESQGRKAKWDCKAWLDETDNPTCLPNREGDERSKSPSGCRKLDTSEVGEGPWYLGVRGGLYFYASGVKVYAPKDERIREYIMKTYTPTFEGTATAYSSAAGSPASPKRTARTARKKSPTKRSPAKKSPTKKASPARKSPVARSRRASPTRRRA
jgi:hypothetical protein